MEKYHHHTTKRKSSFSNMVEKIKTPKNISNKKLLNHNSLLKRVFHPDYILFDWEFFSRELEFE